MTGVELIAAVTAAGGSVELSLDREHVRCKLPRHAQALLEQVRQCRDEVLEALKRSTPPPDDATEGCGQPSHRTVLCRSVLSGLVGSWLSENSGAVSGCATSFRILRREFSFSAAVEIEAVTEDAFLEALLDRGFMCDESGMVLGLILANDFLAALDYERGRTGLPEEAGRQLFEGGNKGMLISAKSKFEIPDEGEHLAVLADVRDLGVSETTYGSKDRLQFIWLVEQLGTDGRPRSVRQKPHNKSMHEKATLRNDIKRILGQDPGDTFDPDTLIGMNAVLEIEHYTREGRTYANIVSIRRPAAGVSILGIPAGFKRAEPAIRLNTDGLAVDDSDVPEFS